MKVTRRRDGTPVVTIGDIRFTIAVPSRKRERMMLTHPLLEMATVFVHETEVEAYERTFRDAGKKACVKPHDEHGVPAIRNAMIENWRPDREFFQLQSDDDIRELRYSYLKRSRCYTTADTILPVCAHAAATAKQIPTGMFMFQQSPRPQERQSFLPFRLRSWGRGDLFGLLDPDLRCDRRMLFCDDMDLSLQCIAKWKVLWMDTRYFVICHSVRGREGIGGDAGIITRDEIDRNYLAMQRKWGAAIIRIGKGKKRGAGLSLRVLVPQSYDQLHAWRLKARAEIRREQAKQRKKGD